MATFTKNKQTGKFDIIGQGLVEGATVTVAKKDGSTTTVTIGKPSREFVAKFGPNEGKKVSIAPVVSSKLKSGYTPAKSLAFTGFCLLAGFVVSRFM